MTSLRRLDHEDHVIAHLDHLRRTRALTDGSLLVFVTAEDAEPFCLVAVEDVPPDPPQHHRVEALGPLVRMVRADGADGVLLVIARREPTEVTGGDLAWHDAFTGTARAAGLSCHGVYVVHAGGAARVVPASRRAA